MMRILSFIQVSWEQFQESDETKMLVTGGTMEHYLIPLGESLSPSSRWPTSVVRSAQNFAEVAASQPQQG